MQVAMFLEKQGIKRVHNLVGGIDAWSRIVDPAIPLY
jgi:rhodanese-related sulfurtransferase